ncbi:UBX domain-containing protein 10 [Stegostoma tigrinum]|uniref:UBX domain-containing protein 10 n=1 Tax=Stegostoma tigrinum TaxID=3053191 RepID=UPI00202B0218|nr:UBX domain-containing protein 10 [Stegostoma tigrinum]XP_059494026.1 UBX domain-containing protein 10 [Stegostoma tigrinum]XP_059494027.1 UBX domain-containing protein 10 [Stegostoma tigrinum]XP_059494028.1 UBX domain-containing protein 10 [Stegostoma tigrinum]
MAAAEPTSRPPSGSKSISSFDLPLYPILKPNTNTMNIPRPKSAKGRSRPSSAYVQSPEICSDPIPVPSAFSDLSNSPPSSTLHPPNRITRVTNEDVPNLIHQVPSRPSSSLNRYKVLPSIGRRESSESGIRTIAQQTNKLNLHADLEQNLKSNKEKKPPPPLSKSRTSTTKTQVSQNPLLTLPDEPSESEPRLRLAVRYPSGQRFERCFRPSDTLQSILSVAEWKSNNNYANSVVETMDVPRRSFSDLSKTLEECGIQNKSVLCILQGEGN